MKIPTKYLPKIHTHIFDYLRFAKKDYFLPIYLALNTIIVSAILCNHTRTRNTQQLLFKQ